MTKNEGEHSLILLSTSYWHSPLKFRRHQWALIASQNGYQVIYVNPTFTITSFFQDEDARKIFWNFFKGDERVNDNLMVITMPPLLPFQRKFLWIDKINRKISGWILKNRLKKLNVFNETIVVVYEPNDLFRTLQGRKSLLVYECVDEHSEYPFNHKVKDKVIEIEKLLLKKADVLSVSSLYLLQKKKSFNLNNVYVPNGVNFELFNRALDPKTTIAKDIDSVPGPIILYVGAIMEWFDYELLLRISDNKKWSIVLIGPQTVNMNLFKDKKNIYCLGVKKQSQLPEYLKKADVCIIPFLINDLVRGVNPLKLYEYLAAGKPVVSTALPDVVPFSKTNFVHIGNNHDEFIHHLEYLIDKRNNSEFVKARTDLAMEYSWENIYKVLFTKIDEVRKQKYSKKI